MAKVMEGHFRYIDFRKEMHPNFIDMPRNHRSTKRSTDDMVVVSVFIAEKHVLLFNDEIDTKRMLDLVLA